MGSSGKTIPNIRRNPSSGVSAVLPPHGATDALLAAKTNPAFKVEKPVIQGIPRKPSSVVSIPNFDKVHKQLEVKASKPRPKITRPEVGRTPGRTSRVRMQERAEFDKANQDYQRRREEALRRYRKEKEVCRVDSSCVLCLQ